jgi:methionyl aminopeptidase
VLRNGDIVNVDVTHIYEGFHGDTSATFYIGTPTPRRGTWSRSPAARSTSGSPQVRDGARLGDIGAAIQEYVEGGGLQRRPRLRRARHRAQVPRRAAGEALRQARDGRARARGDDLHDRADGQCLGGWEVEVDPADKWTVRTADGSLSAQFEHTLLVTRDGVRGAHRARSRSAQQRERRRAVRRVNRALVLRPRSHEA